MQSRIIKRVWCKLCNYQRDLEPADYTPRTCPGCGRVDDQPYSQEVQRIWTDKDTPR